MGNLSLDEKGSTRTIKTNVTVKIDIDGKTLFVPPAGSAWRLMALYANVALPAPGTAARENLARGGWRAWFQQKDTAEADDRDETGYLGYVPVSRFGAGPLLISHIWPHTVDRDPWEFCFRVNAFSSTGRAVSQSLKLGTRQVKILEMS